ncbi:MAG: hypothetical protein U0P45_06040 [Acidimicrobiales bacterium]
MALLFGLLGLVLIVVIGLVVLGRETARLAAAPRPAVFDMEEAVAYIADRLPVDVQGRLSHDDVRWVLLADADLLEEAEAFEDPEADEDHVVDEDAAVARILEAADASGRDIADEDVVAVLDGRMAYLEAIGAIGPEA